MKFGMCGVRGHGNDFVKLFGLHPDVESVAIADLDASVRDQAQQITGVTHAVESLSHLR